MVLQTMSDSRRLRARMASFGVLPVATSADWFTFYHF